MGRVESINRDGSISLSFLDKFETNLEGEKAFLPFSEFKLWIPEDDPWSMFRQSFPIGRLHEIGQLGLLSYTGPTPKEIIFAGHHHTRALHTQQVALIGKEIVKRNGGTPFQQEFMMTVGGLHDIATPAYGDPTKLVDKKNLDEEDRWQDVLSEEQIALLESKGFKLEDINDAIHNKGLCGRILDIVDRISYTAQDAFEIAGGNFLERISFDGYTSVIQSIVSHDKKFADIYKDVGIDWQNNDVFFNDPKKLEVFLSLRSYLHLFTYMYPVNQGRDIFFANLLKPFYSENEYENNQLLTPQKLRKMGDFQLMDYLNQAYGFPDENKFGFDFKLLNWYPENEWFETSREADKRLEELSRDNKVIVIGKKEVKGFDTGTNYRVAVGNKIVPFSDLEESAKIDKIVGNMRGFNVFYTTNDRSEIANLAIRVNDLNTKKLTG